MPAFLNFPTEMGHFTPSLNGPFGSPRVVPMPQVDVVHVGPPGGLPNGLGVLAGPVLVEMPPMPPPAVADATTAAAPPPPALRSAYTSVLAPLMSLSTGHVVMMDGWRGV